MRLTVLYDDRCAFCRRCRDWLAGQPCLVDVELLPASSAAARSRYGELPWFGKELVVVDERGGAWIGPAAFLTCLWATARYRSWSYRLARPRLAPLTDRFFLFVSGRRDRLSTWLGRDDPQCTWCDELRRLGADP
jgi:predicted DCC family thiol-disulfide oxidoreductase YuxK